MLVDAVKALPPSIGAGMDRGRERKFPRAEAASEECYRIQALDKAMEIPGVHYLWDKSTEVYNRVKGSNVAVHRALDTFENVVSLVVEKTALPVARLMEKQIFTLDRTVCQGLDFVQVKLPMIKEEPKRILDRTKRIVLATFKELKEGAEEYVSVIKIRTSYRVHYLRSYSWQQADRVMSTGTGATILKTVDTTTELAELLLVKYLPSPEEEEAQEEGDGEEEDYCDLGDECSEHDNLHHTMIRLSEFGSRASRRIHLAWMDRLQHMYKIEIIVLILHTLIVIQVVRVLEILFGYFLKSVNYAV